RIEAGRLIDEASVDFYSAHVAETFLQDTATRDPLLFSGFNLGNGVRGQVQLFEGVRAAVTFNAGNPVSNTASLLVGGPFPPFGSFAYTRNDTLLPNNLAVRAAERYAAVNVGGGMDVDVARRFKCAHDCADGFGAQYQQVQFQIGDGLVTTNRYVNVGGTIWI